MKLSLEWLGQYVDIRDIDPSDLALKLTMSTAEVEGVETVERTVNGIVAAEIIAVEPLDSGDSGKTISLVTVDVGGKTYTTVCGAPNVAVRMKSPFAAPGTVIADGTAVREQVVYGKTSYGMLLSPLELGWGESHVGIMSFPDSIQTGTPLADIVPSRDHVIEIDNKSITHRPDLWGHYGFARELAAVYGRELIPLSLADSSDWAELPSFPLRIEDYEGCPGYCCLDIDGLTAAFSPLPMQYRLLSIGQRPINLLVDLTNFIMYELGQPMHAFDGERVRDVIVAPFGRNGKFKTLDSVERAMLPDDLMIMDHTGPIALAGVMGGEESEIKENTSRVLLESANFNPSRIRRTALRLGLRTDASLRFEKGQPLYHMGVSIRRFVRLLEESGQNPVAKSNLTGEGNLGETYRTLTVSADFISRSIGEDVSMERIVSILESLEFGCEPSGDELHLNIPRHRSERDISIPNDILEEVARIYGYDNITPSMPEIRLREYPFNPELQKQHKIRRYLSISRGFNEAHSYSWYDDSWLARIGYEPGKTLCLKNPASEQATRMRKDIIPNLLAIIESNAAHRDRFFMYEVGNVFAPVDGGCKQAMHLAGIGYQSSKLGGIEELFLSVKGTVEEMFEVVNTDFPSFRISGESSAPWQFPGATLDIVYRDTVIGRLGYFTGREWTVFAKDTLAVWFELDIDSLSGLVYPDPDYAPLPVYPGSWMDFSILADASGTFMELENTVSAFTHPILTGWKFLYHYAGKGLPEGKLSYTFRFWLGLRQRTLTGDDLTDFRSAFLSYIEGKGLSIR